MVVENENLRIWMVQPEVRFNQRMHFIQAGFMELVILKGQELTVIHHLDGEAEMVSSRIDEEAASARLYVADR